MRCKMEFREAAAMTVCWEFAQRLLMLRTDAKVGVPSRRGVKAEDTVFLPQAYCKKNFIDDYPVHGVWPLNVQPLIRSE